MKTDALALAGVRALAATGEARRIRTRAQLSLGDIAQTCGVAPSTVHRWESGHRVPRGEPALRYGALLSALVGQAQRQAAS